MRLKPILIASAAYFALTLVAYAESASNQTGGTISTPGSEAKSNPIPVPPAAKSGEREQGYVIVTPAPPPTEPEVSPPPPPPQ
jgi:hypothetical protein